MHRRFLSWAALFALMISHHSACPAGGEGKPKKSLSLASFGYYPKWICFSPDGKHLAICLNDLVPRRGWVMLGTAEGKQFKKFVVEKFGLASIAFSPDAKTLAVSCEDGLVSLLAVPSGKKLWGKQHKSRTTRYTSRLAFSPDGRVLVLGSDHDGSIRLCDASTGKLIRMMEGHVWDAESTVTVLSFSPDGRFLASGATDRSLRLWDVATGDQIWAHVRRTGAPGSSTTWTVPTVSFSDDGRMVGGIGPDQRVWLWERVSGKVRFRFRGDRFLYGGGITQGFGIISGAASFLAVSPSGKLIAKVTLGKAPKNRAATPCTLAVWRRSSLSIESRNLLVPTNDKIDVPNLVSQLSSRDAAAAYKAILVLARSAHALHHLKRETREWRSFFSTQTGIIRKCVLDLNSAHFSVRERATRKLKKLARLNPVILRRALQQKLSNEAQRRVKGVLQDLHSRPVPKEVLFLHRAIEVLELTASHEAKTLLKEIGDAFPPELGLEAKASRQRLAGQKGIRGGR